MPGAGLSLQYSPDSVVLEGLEPAVPGFPIVVLRRSTDLSSWEEIGMFRDQLHAYSISHRGGSNTVFYQTIKRRPKASDDWANQLLVPESALMAQPMGGGLSGAPFCKFTIELSSPERGYFQDSSKYPFHYTFIRERLLGYENLDFMDFERVALRREEQELVLGTVLLAPDPAVAELAIQIAGQEAFDVTDAIDWFQASVRRLAFGFQDYRVFYMPTFEQRDVTFAHEERFMEAGIRLATPSRWASDPVCYSEGWALGRLRFIGADEINAAYGDGRLGVNDILVTDFVPAEVPVVAGIVSFNPATPNSHVVLLARSSDVPVAFASGEGLQAQIKAWEGQEVLLTVYTEESGCDLKFQNLEGKLSGEERESILALKARPPVAIQEKEVANQLWFSTENLRSEDIRFVGGKAANFGFLRRSIPEHSPESIAFTFDLWDQFMAQTTEEGLSLKHWISEILSPFETDPPDISELRTALHLVQERIQDRAAFTSALQDGVIEALQGFSADRKLRFRSSTNVEDSEQFSGAGLYDSFSGCLLDDLDADSRGPSHCDPSRSEERGVFRAIRKVFASFYNENAYLERLRHGVDEGQVAMGILVHPSFPDPLELANGVATLAIDRSDGGERRVIMTLVTQLGAVSVANPAVDVLPEVVRLTESGIEREAESTLVPVGQTVMEWETDYRELGDLLEQAAREFESAFLEKDRLLLDFEYKKMAPGDLVVKQIRLIPQRTPVPPPTFD